MKKKETYTIIVHYVGHEDIIQHNVDKLSATIIPPEFEMAFPKEFKNGKMSIEVVKE